MKAPEVNEIWKYPLSGDTYLVEGTDVGIVYIRNIMPLHINRCFIYRDSDNTMSHSNSYILDNLTLWGYLDENEEVVQLWR